MGTLFSSISAKFNTALILGALLPVAVHVLLGLFVTVPLFPGAWSTSQIALQIDTVWLVLALTTIVVLLSGLIYTLNNPIIRLFEGYPWRATRFGRWRTNKHIQQHLKLQAQSRGLYTLIEALSKSNIDTERQKLPLVSSYLSSVLQRTTTIYPASIDSVLPSRLGNVIASFESYPNQQYSIDAVALWPRLTAVIEPNYAAMISDSKTSVDFMLNNSVLSMIQALMLLFVGLIFQRPLLSWQSLAVWLLTITAFVVLAYISYLGSINRALEWGTLVKSAFDLYRWDLLKQLGYTAVPPMIEEERTLWSGISQQSIFGDSPTRRSLMYDREKAAVRGYYDALGLRIVRGVKPQSDDSVMIIIQAQNIDKTRSATRVIINDWVPDGYQYRWGSALWFQPQAKKGNAITPDGRNPYTFWVGKLPPNSNGTLIYVVVPQKKS